MADKGKSIIIKKIKKGHGGHHGGAWKVAYADFVTAMMAFFLLLWLMTMTDQQKKIALSKYFTDFSMFEKSGTSMLKEGYSGVMKDPGGGKMSTLDIGKKAAMGQSELLKDKLKKEIEEKLQSLKDQTAVEIFEGGVRIQIFDLEGKSMFLPGSAQLSQSAKQIIKLVGENIRELPNKIAVEGHTDAAPLKKGQITNWELSTDRASSARRELELNGVKHDQIARVVGYADTEPLIKERPTDPQNRRISIILLQSKVAEMTQPTKAAPEAKPAQPPPPPPPSPVQQEPAVKKTPAFPQDQKKDAGGLDLGIRPKGPIEIKGPIKDVAPSPGRQDKPIQPKAEQQKQVPVERPAPPPPPPPSPKVEPQTKKQPAEKSAPKQDLGIKPIAPIVPGVQGKGQPQPVQPKAGQQKQSPDERPSPPPPPPKSEPKAKKPVAEKPAVKQEQKKAIGIEPIAPIVPGIGR
ncbi:MAG: OmpA family protein [Nitrospirae bacterium]|nr:OmpA family protein [Nitrospirota bacterium]